MVYTRVKNREEDKKPFSLGSLKFEEGDTSKVDITTKTDTAIAKSTPNIKYTPISQRFRLGEGLDKTAEVLPFPFKKSAEQTRQAEIFGQDITTSLEAPEAPLGKSVTEGRYIPVGIRVKIPFIQKGFTLPENTISELTKDLIQSPEKIIKSAIYNTWTDEQKEAFKIKDETKIFQSPLYQKDYKQMVDNGVSPIAAFALTGISAAVDASIFADLIARPIIKVASKIPVSRATVENLTRKDIINVMRGEEFAGKVAQEKAAAFIKAREIYGENLTKILRKSGNKIEVKMSEGKTLGQWMKEQGYQPGLSIKDVSKDIAKSDDLTQQAKKFDNVDDFIKAQDVLYRGDAKKIPFNEMDTTKIFKPGETESLLAFTNTPGLYFTNSLKNAKSYGENITNIIIDNNANIINVKDVRNILSRNDVKKIVKSNPNIKETALNWSDNIEDGINNIVNSIMEETDGNEFLKAIWGEADFSPKDFTKTMSNFGIDGIKIEKEGVNHFVIYNKNAVKTKQQLIDIFNKAKGSSLAEQAKKFDNVDDFASKIDIGIIEKEAFGFSSGDIKLFKPKDLVVNLKDDLDNAIFQQEKSGLSKINWAKTVDLSEPIDVSFEGGKFIIEDGHHRYLAAKILDKPLKAEVNIIDSPIKKLGGKDFDSFLKDIFNKAKGDTNLYGAGAGIEQDEDGNLTFDPLKATLGLGVSKIVRKGVKASVPRDVYKANRSIKKGIGVVVSKDIKSIIKGITQGTDKYLGTISTRLKNINPELKRELRSFEYKTRDNILKDTKKVKPFLDLTKKMSKDDKLDFDLARKNGDSAVIQDLIKKYKIGKEYNALRETLDDLYKRAEDVGYDIGYKKSYHPRMIKDKEGFIEYFRNGEDWNTISQAIKTKENAIQRYLTEEEKAQLINTMIRGFNQNSISLSAIGNMKSREIDLIDAELNQFYMSSNASLVSYIRQANEAIEARRFFGKTKRKEGVTIDDSIGSYVLRQLEKGKITPQQEATLSEILKARFNQTGTRGVVNLYKNLSYIDTMGSVTSAITQIGDLTWALNKAGVVRTSTSLARAIAGKSKIKKEDVGIDSIAQEFEEPSKAAKAVDVVFRLTGLNKMDSIGKETLINSVITKYQDWAKSGNKKLEKSLEPVFGKNTEELRQVIEDLKSGYITENVKLLALNELADFQPILLSEMPQKYLTGGNGRIFYMLKTFTIKQFDIYRNEIFQKIADKATRGEGIKNLIRLVGFFVIMNATADEIKDIILNRKTSLKDRTVDNILRAVGFSKYLTWKVRTEGIGSATARQILPPFKFIDSVTKDITQGIENGSEIVQSIPIGGKLYYWWLGKGQYKNEKRKKESETTKLDEFEERIKKIEGENRLKEFEERINKIQLK